MDWEDPELNKLRQEFLGSLPERLSKIRAVLTPGVAPSAARNELKLQAHKLAGLGGTYGFPKLSEVSGVIEDQIEDQPSISLSQIKGITEWIAEIERTLGAIKK